MRLSRSFPSRSKGRPPGIALVLVLVFLVLLSALLIAFFTNIQTDLQGARSYASSVTSKQLAETTVNLVMSQITDGTRTFEEPGNPKSTRLTWASQPGLIRSYEQDGSIGRTFKLFSAGQMVTPPSTDYIPVKELPTEIPNEWPLQPALYTDLNSPVLISDPRGSIKIAGKPTNETYSASYPILDPLALLDEENTPPGVDGFKIENKNISGGFDNIPGFKSKTWTPTADYNPTLSDDSRYTANPAPMPVQWIYVLQNGSLTSPAGVSSDGRTANWNNITSSTSPNKPSRTNPIVGRIAFWTDDETCKLNINTASEGVFWDRPWANSTDASSPYAEHSLAQRIPAQNEFQRFAGHPAMTCLSPVLGIVPKLRPPKGMAISAADYTNIFEPYYKLTPRVGLDGTKAGTFNSSTDPAFKITLDQDRLYASVDELVFSPQPLPGLTASRIPNANLSRTAVEKAKFFLTAYNRAPEVNLFARPRITLWPLQQDPDPNAGRPDGTSGGGPATCPTTPRNAKDTLIAFCSSIGFSPTKKLYPFYFQRYSIYLRDAVNNRGAGGRPKNPAPNNLPIPFMQIRDAPYKYEPPSSQIPGLDWQITRNRELYNYLRDLTDQSTPGVGKSFKTKYGAKDPEGSSATERDQIFTEMIDLARSGLNTYSTGLKPRYESAPARDMPDASIGETQLVPLIPGSPNLTTQPGFGTKGFGRFPTITEAGFLFYAQKVQVPGAAAGAPQLRCLFLVEPASPTCGPASWSPLVRYVVKGLNSKVVLNGQSNVFIQDPLVDLVTSRAGYGSGSNHSTAFNGLFMSFRRWAGSGSDANKHILSSLEVKNAKYDEELDYPFVSRGVPVDAATGKFTFDVTGDGVIEVEVHAGYERVLSAETLVQTLRFKFPKGSWQLPQFPKDTALLEDEPAGPNIGINSRITGSIGSLVNTGTDLVRTVELDPLGPSKGDLRLLAGRRTVPENFFAPYPSGADGAGYADAKAPMVHSLRLGNGAQWGGKLTAKLLAGLAFTDGNPVAARGTVAALINNSIAGDWDNGNGTLEDGAYINKPDEGNARDSEGAYFSAGSFTTETGQTFSPNRQVSSAVMFGSLSTGVFSQSPWQTLLFCANPAAGRQHPGFTQPRDHFLLDLFTMPIVEPYAISEPFSTAGKVNLNYQIAPFTYLKRSTALRGVLKSTKVMAIPTGGSKSGSNFRKNIDANETLEAFEQRFRAASGGFYTGDTGPFRAASEICDMYLVPEGAKLADIKNWWNGYLRTGDNAREIPYGHIYPRVTTKSNTFTVHMRVQVLRKRPSTNDSDYAFWTEGKDQILSEFRGSTLLERYIDPNDPNLPDFADFKNHPEATMDDFYKFRIVSSRKFTP